jgi:hypothetical protein
MQWYQQLQDASAKCVLAFEDLTSSKDSQVGERWVGKLWWCALQPDVVKEHTWCVMVLHSSSTCSALDTPTYQVIILLTDQEDKDGLAEGSHHPSEPDLHHCRWVRWVRILSFTLLSYICKL